MSLKTKTIGLSVAMLLAGAGGLYAFMPDNQESASDDSETVGLAQPIATADMTDPVSTVDEQIRQGAAAPGTEKTVAPKRPAKDQPENPPSKKLTRQQLLPPPATENEKLEKAAQQESNF